MKHISFLFRDDKAYKEALKKASKNNYKSLLIQIYCGTTNPKTIKKILKKVSKDFPNATIIGASTAGEISHAKIYEQETVLSFSFFKHTHIQVHYTQEISTQSGIEVAKKIANKHTKAFIILGEGLKTSDYESYLNGIKKRAPQAIIAGGLAGDNFQLLKTYIFLNDTLYNEGIVALSFSSKQLIATNKYNLNWTPIGKEFTITSVEGNKVHTINDIPAVAFFKKYLGEDAIFHDTATTLPNFQLLFKEGSTTVARTPLAIDGESLIFAATLQQGQKVQFGFSNEASVLEGAYNLRDELVHAPAEAIYLFSCIARKTLLGEILEKEFHAFEEIAPTTGFFTYGEFYSTDANDVLLNCTTTLLLLSESSKVKKIKKRTLNRATLDNITFNAFVHFIEQTSKELETNIQLMNQYKNAVDASLLVSKTDKNGIITYVNDNFCRISKYSKEELLGHNHNIVRDPNIPPIVFYKMWSTIKSGKIWKGVFSNRSKDGTIYHVSATIMPIFDNDGTIEEYIAIRQDITKQVLANKKMEAKEKLIRAILDNQESIVIHASKTQGMLGVNQKLFDYFDYKNFDDFKTRSKCICDLFLDEEGYVHPSRQPNWLEDIAADEKHDYKVKMVTKTGEVHTFTIKIKKISDEYILNLYDITTLEQALVKAYSSEKAKATFMANMSHEIRTPLNGILGFTDILMKKDLDKDTKKYIDIIHKSGETLLNVVNDILDFSKIESGELTLYETPATIFDEMEATVSTFASIAKNKKIHYYTYIDTSIPRSLKCDIQRLKQVMNNLISNAIKFTPQEGEVTVRVECKAKEENKAHLHFSVADTGIGIEQEKLKTIFQAFSQADNSISREFGGTGLGLAISNQYIHMMGSSIEVKSEVGKGSEFFFDLTFEILDERASVETFLNNSQTHIALMNSYEGIVCGVNDIVSTYLDAWQCNYEIIENAETISDKYDILILCAKLFNQEKCKNILATYPQLKLIYIEGSEKGFECDHERFFLIEQPMTGSSLFDTLVPLMDSEAYTYKETKNTISTTHHYNGKVLIAEDNETNQLLISIMLDERGIQYHVVNNGQEAVEELLKNTYELVLMDINMPVLDGIGATKELRKAGYSHPIVSLSANVIEADTEAFKEAGMDDTLNKPIIPKELDHVLDKYLIKKEKPTKKEEVFDTIDTASLQTTLMLDYPIIKKLFASLIETFWESLEEIQQGHIDKALLHKLKGTAGNMRFQHLYNLCASYEKSIESMTQEEKKEAQERLIQHLTHAIEEIQKI